jgi:hypothetical protein
MLCNDDAIAGGHGFGRVALASAPLALEFLEDGVAGNSGELAERHGDPDAEPSADWGWHGSYPKGKIIAGWISIVLLIALAIGPYQSKTQDLWIGGFVLLILFLIWRETVKKRRAWKQS